MITQIQTGIVIASLFHRYDVLYCHNSESDSLIKQLCNGLSSCSLSKNDLNIADPCFGVYKMIAVDYECEFRLIN